MPNQCERSLPPTMNHPEHLTFSRIEIIINEEASDDISLIKRDEPIQPKESPSYAKKNLSGR